MSRQRDAAGVFAVVGTRTGHRSIVANPCHPFVRGDGFCRDGGRIHLLAFGEILLLEPRSTADHYADIVGAERWNILGAEPMSATIERRTTP